MSGLLDRTFGLAAAGTTVRREVTAGLVTFFTLSYILFVQPVILSSTGMDPGGVLLATCLASALACFAMALLANYPFALAPAMGHNVFFAFTVCGAAGVGMGFRWQEALAANLLAGAVFLALAGVGFREKVMNAIPEPLKYAVAAGIGLLIALIGLEWAGVVVDHPVLHVQLGELGLPPTLLALFGLALSSALLVRRVPGALLIGLGATAVAGWLASSMWGLTPALVSFGEGSLFALPEGSSTAFQLDFAGLFARPASEWLAVIGVFLILDLFDTVGTLVGLADRAGFLKDGRLPRAERALAADAAGTVVGAVLGTSTVTTYVESAAGVASGGRTGLTAVVVGLGMLGALFLAPLIQAVGAGVDVGLDGAVDMRYPVIAPVLILVGALMMGAVKRIRWDELSEAFPAFLTIVVMQLSTSITDGIAWGFLSWSLLALVGGHTRRTSPLVHALSLLFLLRYLWLT